MAESREGPPKLERRSFLKGFAAALGTMFLPGEAKRAPTAPVEPAPEPRAEIPKEAEKPLVSEYATLKDILGENYDTKKVNQGENEENPPQLTELGAGFWVTSHAEGFPTPKPDQVGPFFWYKGERGELPLGDSKVVGQAEGVTAIEVGESGIIPGYGANFLVGLDLATNQRGEQALSFWTDNAAVFQKEDGSRDERSFDPISAKFTINTAKGPVEWELRQDRDLGLHHGVLIPLGLDPEQLPVAKNIITGIDHYRSIKSMSVSFTDGSKNLTFDFMKKPIAATPTSS